MEKLFVTNPLYDTTDEKLERKSEQWFSELRDNASKEEVELREANEDEISKPSEMNKMLDNKRFQRFDYKEACTNLNISDPKRPQLPGMPFDMVLKTWQVVAIDAILHFEGDPDIRAAILADSTGLGRQWMSSNG